MTPDQFRLSQAATQHRLTAIARLLPGLRGVSRFMMSGAHPDDERAPMLSALQFRDGVSLSYACSTRGEGGQNNLGTERGGALGALRTAEMEAACDVLNMRMYWLSQSPDDSITDWRFSKSGEETLDHWGYDRTLRRMVEILRRDRPDMLCPTFLDVPGQHGHHRAMTRIAHDAFDAAADPGFDTGQPVWAVAKLYLPAWSGAGRAYDDDVPPPKPTVIVSGVGDVRELGQSYALIGAISHGCHRSQGMGHWPDGQQDYPLHLAESRVGPDANAITDNVPHSFADIGLDALDGALAELDLMHLDGLADIHDILARADIPEHAHRIDAKRRAVARLMTLSAGRAPITYSPRTNLSPGETTFVTGLPDGAQLRVPDGWQVNNDTFGPVSAPPTDGYRDSYDPHHPPLPAIEVTTQGGTSLWPLSQSVIVSPLVQLTLDQTRYLVNVGAGQRAATVPVSSVTPENWPSAQTNEGLTLEATTIGRHRITLRDGDRPAHIARPICYPHVRDTQFSTPAAIDLCVIDARLPTHPVAYVGAKLDTVPGRLRDIGITVIEDDAFAAPTLLVGIHAFGFNDALAQLRPQIHDWVRKGGNLVTLYHRPWDDWDPDATPPLQIEIGQPSLRWRVTQKDAPVTLLCPDHPLMTGPNPITKADFDGWEKERGLYFAKRWDPAYQPLLSMSDTGEPALEGALLAADIGQGRHVHVALNLHEQLERGVCGAIRLLCNCLQAPEAR